MASRKAVLGLSAVLCLMGASGSAGAQDAAETAQILSGVSRPHAGAGRSLGSAITQSLDAARDAIAMPAAMPIAMPRRAIATGHPRLRQRAVIPANGDPLERFDAPTYKLGNGATIRVSGGLANATCVENCPAGRTP